MVHRNSERRDDHSWVWAARERRIGLLTITLVTLVVIGVCLITSDAVLSSIGGRVGIAIVSLLAALALVGLASTLSAYRKTKKRR